MHPIDTYTDYVVAVSKYRFIFIYADILQWIMKLMKTVQ